MAPTALHDIVERLRFTVCAEQATDAELLGRFVETSDEAAFSEISRRHGPMVWGVCTRAVSHWQDAEDCFQATFLILLRKANVVYPRFSLGAWLHGVACKVTQKARASAQVRSLREHPLGSGNEPAAPPEPDKELRWIIDQELVALPEKYRLPILLCELEGRTLKEVAQEIGCPIGTVAGRLARGRKLLGERLVQRGFVAGTAGILMAIGASAQGAGPGVAVGTASTQAAALAQFILGTMAAGKIKTLFSVAVGVLLLFSVVGFLPTIWSAGTPEKEEIGLPNLAAADQQAPEKPSAESVRPKPDAPTDEVKLGNARFLHPTGVSHVLFSRDGKEVSTVGGGSLRWWALPDGNLVSEPITPKDNKLPAAEASVTISADNGTLVVVQPTAGRGSILAVIDPRTGKFRHAINVFDNVGLERLRVSHNGMWAVGLTGRTVVVWNLAEGKKSSSLESPGVQAVAVSNDGKRVALTVQWHKTEIRTVGTGELVWDVSKSYPPMPKEQPRLENLESHEQLAFSPDGKRLATAGTIAVKGAPSPAPVRLWDTDNKKHLWQYLPPPTAMARNIQFSPNGKLVGSVFYQDLYLFETATGKLAHELRGGAGSTGQFSISTDGKWAGMSAGRKLRLWELVTHREPAALIGPRDPARLLARAPNGKYIASGGGGPEVWLWEKQTPAPRAVRASVSYWAFDLAFSPDSKRLLTVTRGENASVNVWDTATGKQLAVLSGGADKLHRAAFSRHGLFAVIDYIPGLHDPETGKAKWTGNPVTAFGNNEPLVVISPTAEYFATDTGVFAVKDGREVARFAGGFPLAVSDDGKRVVYKAKDGAIGLHVASAIQQPEARVKVGAVYAIAPGADRAAVVVGLSLRVYDLATGKELCACERPAAVPEDVWAKWWARGVKFSPDGKLLVAHETTPGLGVWDAETGKSVAWLVPDVHLPLSAYAFTGPKTVVAAYGSGDLIRVWDAEIAPRR